MSKKDIEYIEILTEDGWNYIPNTESTTNKKRRFKLSIILLIIVLLLLLISIPIYQITYSMYKNAIQTDPKVKVATWNFKINSNGVSKLDIDLSDTVVANNFSDNMVIPGAEGEINLNIDFSTTKVATNYEIKLDPTSTIVPPNLKFYVDETKTQEFSSYIGTIALADIDKPINKKIYWQWSYTTEDETLDWSNKQITLALQAIASQKVS